MTEKLYFMAVSRWARLAGCGGSRYLACMHRILVYLLPLLLLACDGNAPDSLTNSEVVRDDGWRVSKLTAAGNYGNGVWWMSERLLAAIIAAAP